MKRHHLIRRIMDRIYRRRRWNRTMTTIAGVIVFITTYMLILPAITLTPELVCPYEENHVHTQECWREVSTQVLVCPYAQAGDVLVVHRHDESCFRDGMLVCPLRELELHEHTGVCYKDGQDFSDGGDFTGGSGAAGGTADFSSGLSTGEVPHAEETICGKTETVLHVHDTSCYDRDGRLICTRPVVVEHQHTAECFFNEVAGMELVCGQPEGHIHTEECYARESLLEGLFPGGDRNEGLFSGENHDEGNFDGEDRGEGGFYEENQGEGNFSGENRYEGDLDGVIRDEEAFDDQNRDQGLFLGDNQSDAAAADFGSEEGAGIDGGSVNAATYVPAADAENQDHNTGMSVVEEADQTAGENADGAVAHDGMDTTEDTAEQHVESTVEAATEPDAETATEVTTEQLVKSAVESTTEPDAESTTEAATDQLVESAVEATTESNTETVTEAPTDQYVESSVEATTEFVADTVTEAVIEQHVESAVETTTESVAEAETEVPTEQLVESAVETTTESVAETATEVPTEQLVEAAVENTTEYGAETTTEGTTEQFVESAVETTTEAAVEATTESPVEWTQTIEYRGSDYTVRLSYDSLAGIPENAVLSAEEIPYGTDLYESYLKQAKSELGLAEGTELPKEYARFFDIRILDGETEIEPVRPVKVEIIYDETVAVPEAEKATVDVLHFDEARDEIQRVTVNPDSGSVDIGPSETTLTEINEAAGEEVRTDAALGDNTGSSDDAADDTLSDDMLSDVMLRHDGAENVTDVKEQQNKIYPVSEETTVDQGMEEKVVTFTADSFSIYGVIYTVHKTVISASGETYEISVSFGKEAMIPENATLHVEEVLQDNNKYEENCAIADNALRAVYDKGLSSHTVMFDISIMAGEAVIEPADGSTVSVEINLLDHPSSTEGIELQDKLKDALQVDEPFESDLSSENVKDINEKDDESDTEERNGSGNYAIYNGEMYEAQADIENGTLEVVHLANDGAAEVIPLNEVSQSADGNVQVKFDTTSFSTYIVTGSQENGENYVFESLPGTIYVGDTINIFTTAQTNVDINTNYGVVTVYKWDDNYYIDGYTGKTARVIYAEKTGKFWLNGKEIKVVDRPAGSHPATVTTVPNSEAGITMNMFDYDLTTMLDDYFNQLNLVRQPLEQSFKEGGINKGKTLKFFGSGINKDWYKSDDRTRVDIDWAKNTYTEYEPGLGIVKSQLSEGTTGYPVLNTNTYEDLAYLFTDSGYNGDVKAYMGVDGLFQQDAQDYYYYDSGKNYAWLNPTTKKFEVYGSTYTQYSKGETTAQGGKPVDKPIGFFPFHEWNSNHDLYVNYNKVLNHHFGLNMEVKFALPSGSMAPVDKYGNPIVFEFNGDDDMWVFIDGKLAMDIGGIHQPIDGKIDFTNRKVTVAGSDQSGYSAWNSLFDGKQHTLQVFYMERGGCDSNCKIRFNLSQYTDVELDKVDEDMPTKTLAGAKFQLFKEVEVLKDGETVTELDPVYWYKKQNDNDRSGVKTPYIAESDANGHVRFEGVPLGNYILKEIESPSGYMQMTDARNVPVYLTKENETTRITYTISGEDADSTKDGMQIANRKPEPMDISFEKKWDDNGNSTPPDGASASFELKRVQKILKKEAAVELQYADGTVIKREEGLYAGDKVIINGYKLNTAYPSTTGLSSNGEARTSSNTGNIEIGQNGGSLSLNTTVTYTSYGNGGWMFFPYQHKRWEESSYISTPVEYPVNPDHADAQGTIILKITDRNASSFAIPPVMSVERSNPDSSNGYETVTVTSFTLPDDADNGESWKKSFSALPKTDLEGNPYQYFIIETGKSGADAYTTVAYTSESGSEATPLSDTGNVEITNSKPTEPDPHGGGSETEELPPATSSKVLTPNKKADGTNDGTYTLTLSVKIPNYKNRSKNRANVVVVYDSSNSMDQALGYKNYGRFSAANPEVYGTINNGEHWDVIRESSNYRWDYMIYDRVKKDWVEYKAAWGFYIPDPAAGTRMTITQNLVKNLGDELLSKNKPGEASGEESIQMAFVEYASLILHGSDRTDRVTADKTTFSNWVAGCEAPGHNDPTAPTGATNWELALKTANSIDFGDDDPTYIIFISDGNPTKRTSRVGWGDDGKGDVPGTYGDGTNDLKGYNLQAANAEAQNIQNAKKMLYAVGIFGDADKMQNLTPRDAYYNANDPDAMKNVFDKIVSEISSRVGYSDVVIEDGITSLTSSTLVPGTSDNFMYKVTDKDGKDVTAEMLAKLGNPEASYTEKDRVSEGGISYKQKEVVWNLGRKDLLLEGGTYSVSFIVWPSQEAYDLAADLNNGLRKFSELNDVEKTQVEIQNGIYVVKTNTHESAKGKTAKEITDADGNKTITPTPDEYKDIPMEKHVDPMPLTDTTVKVQKKWKAALDKTQLADIKDHTVYLELDKDNKKYIGDIVIQAPKPITVPDGDEWIWPETVTQINQDTGQPETKEAVHHISAGQMVSKEAAEKSGLNVQGYSSAIFEADGSSTTYYILEPGRDYAFKETGESDYRFELEGKTFHPMVVDGVLCDVTFKSGSQISEIKPSTGNTMNLTALNELKGGILIYKKVYAEDGKTEVTNDKTKFTIKVSLTNPSAESGTSGTKYEVSADKGGYRINYGTIRPENEKDYGTSTAGNNEASDNRDKNRSRRYGITGGEFTAEIYADESIQVANVSKGVQYEVEEENVPSGYEKIGIEYNIADKTMTAETSHQVTVKNRQTAVGLSFRKVWLSAETDVNSIKEQDLKEWENGNTIHVVLKRSVKGKEDSSFSLTFQIDSGDGPFRPVDNNLSTEDKENYKLTKTKDGKITVFELAHVLESVDADGDAYTYYVEESAAGPGLYTKYYGTAEDGEVKVEKGLQSAGDGQAIINLETQGYELPSTGGSGTHLLYMMGILLMCLAGIGLILKRNDHMA